MKKKVSSALLALSLTCGALALPIPAQAGGAINPNTGGVPGSWTAGTTPAAVDPNKPAILFVHGLNGNATTWYASNNMYQYAYDSGYQTAFINLHDITGTSQSMWDNGSLLAGKIQEISQHFGKNLVIVAHSKGGVDTQAALVHYNAYPYVSNVITLGSPHRGSQLADLAYSSWASWLSGSIGAQSPGAASMQTSYMTYFRSVTDAHANAGKNKFYTLAGNSWETGSTAHFFGGLFLSTYGANDGVVTVANAAVPGGTMLKVGAWDHSTVKTGNYTFNLFKSYLTMPAAKSAMNQVHIAAAPESFVPSADENSSLYVRGGEHQGTASETLVVENGVSSVSLNWISDRPVDELHIFDPKGKQQKVKVTTTADEDLFKGAWHHTATIKKPAAGEWKIESHSSQAGAYLFTAAFETGKKTKAKLKKEKNSKELNVELEGLKKEKTNVTYSMDFYKEEAGSKGKFQANQPKKLKKQEEKAAENSALSVPAENGAGVYNITAEIEGETSEGFPYRRTIVKSVYVDEQGQTYAP